MKARQPSPAPDPGQAHLEGLSTAFAHRQGADPAVVRRTLVSLRRTVHDEDDLPDLLDRAAAAAVAWLPDAHSAGITVSLGASTFTAASTDSRVVALDEAQHALRHGPCMHAMTIRATVAMSLAEVTSSAGAPHRGCAPGGHPASAGHDHGGRLRAALHDELARPARATVPDTTGPYCVR